MKKQPNKDKKKALQLRLQHIRVLHAPALTEVAGGGTVCRVTSCEATNAA